MKDLLLLFAVEDDGQDLVEYALVAAVISLASVAGLNSLANAIAGVPNGLMQKFWSALSS